MHSFLFLIGFLNFGYFYSKLSKKKLTIVLPTIFFMIFFILYLSGIIFSNFKPGIYFIYILSVSTLIYNIYYLLKIGEDYPKNILGQILSICLIFKFLPITLVNFRSNFWDDFSHWLLTVKNMIIFNQIPINPESTVSFTSYPPSSGIIEYFYNYIQQKHSIDYNSQFIFNFLMIIILLAILDMKNISKKSKLLMFPILLIIPALTVYEIYSSLLVDGILGIMGAYILVYYEYTKDMGNNKFKIFDIALAVSFLTLLKPTGSVIVIFCIIYICLDVYFKQKYQKSTIVVIILSLIFSRFSWAYYLKKHNIVNIWKMGKVKNVLNIFFKRGEDYQYRVIKTFWKAIFKKNIIVVPEEVRLITYCMFFMILFGILLSMYLNKKDKNILKLLIFNTIISLIYPLLLLLMYISIFSQEEAEILAAYERYLSTVILFLILFNIWMLVKEKFLKKYCILLIIIFFFLSSENLELKRIFNRKNDNSIVDLENERIEIPSKIMKLPYRNTKIYYLSVNTKPYYQFLRFQYDITPIKLQSWDEVMYSKEANLRERIKNYNYIYVDSLNSNVIEKYKDIFNRNMKLKTFYKVENLNGKIILTELR